jgi:glutathione synthase/RimK-type ligase-like ATP-grasp enzyme
VSPSVGVLGRATDPHAAAVARLAANRGATVALIDTALPSFARWGWRDGRLHDHRGEAVELDAVYVRSVAAPVPRHETPEVTGPVLARWLDQAERRRRTQVHARAVHAGLEAAGTFVVNSVDATWLHRSKPAADLRLRAAGIATPRCLVTDDPAAVRRFVGTVGETVRKPIAGGGACVAVDPGALSDADLAGLVTAPTLFQERIRGDDLRIYVVDGEVVAAAHIHTEALDYRGHEDDVVAIEPGDELTGLCRHVAATLGLVFTGIDVKRAADGTLTVLDTNPSPMFLGIERRTGQPIGDRLAARLVAAGAASGDGKDGSHG